MLRVIATCLLPFQSTDPQLEELYPCDPTQALCLEKLGKLGMLTTDDDASEYLNFFHNF